MTKHDYLGRWFRLVVAALVAVLGVVTVAPGQVTADHSDSETVIDSAGPDDEPGQKDLTQLTVVDDHSGTLIVTYNFDNTSTSGANTLDACALFDTDVVGTEGFGFADFAQCNTIEKDGTNTVSQYKCSDEKADRCTNPEVVTTFVSTSSSAIESSDPFGTSGRDNSDCADAPACLTQDYVVTANIFLADFSSESATLIDVCSYPSQQPNSDPSDCVVNQTFGRLQIVKDVENSADTDFVFTTTPQSRDKVSVFTITGAGTVEAQYVPTADLSIRESVPEGYDLTNVSCAIQRTDGDPTATGTPDETVDGALVGVAGVTIQGGLLTICTFTNVERSDITFDKTFRSDPVRNADGSWSLAYQIDVVNADGAGEGEYDLSDTFAFGEGVTIVSGSADVDGGDVETNDLFDGVANPEIVTDRTIAGGTTHTYVVTVDVTIAVGPATDGDCIGDGATGFLNTISIAIDSDDAVTDEVCQGFATLTLNKQLVNDDGGNATLADFPLTATGSGATISGVSPVASAVPAGSYTLSELSAAGYTASSFSCGTFELTGDVLVLADGDNASCTITNNDGAVDLALTKSDGGASAVAGGPAFSYTISVSNIGTRNADLGEPVTVTDTLPSGLVWVSFPTNCTQAGQTLTCSLAPASLTAGGAPVVITASVRALASAASGTYTNQASVTTADDPVCTGASCTPPPCPALGNNNVDCEETPVDRASTITIVKTDDVASGQSVQRGDAFAYTLRVTNNGPSSIQPGLVVTDDVPAELDLVSVTGGTGWTCNNADPITCTYGPSLAPGATASTITVNVTVADDATGDTIANVAVATGQVDGGETVTDDDDESTPLITDADLAIVKTASVTAIGAGASFNWQLVISNQGPATATDVVISDAVPSMVTVTGVSSSDFACSSSGNNVTCLVSSLAVGASGTVTITVATAASSGGDVDNVATVAASTPDPVPGNNSDDATVTIVAQLPPPVTLPATGSGSTGPITTTALALMLVGGSALLATRRRRTVLTAN